MRVTSKDRPEAADGRRGRRRLAAAGRGFAGTVLLVLGFVAAGGAMSAAFGKPPLRGEMVDVGGRSLRIVCAGPAEASPLIVLEAGAFGFAADWASVQSRLARRGIRSCAYDRAGMGFSDPGPSPRDGTAVQADLDRLLAAKGLAGPYVYVGHSMAGLRARLFVDAHGEAVLGLVLVDAAGPEATRSGRASRFVRHFATVSDWAAIGASAGLFKPVAGVFGDKIGLAEEASREKRWAFARGAHNRAAADEVRHWVQTADQAAATPAYDPALPVAVVMAGSPDSAWGRMKAAPALASRAGRVDAVAGAGHATLLGETYADAIVEGVEHVLRESGARGPDATKAASSTRP